MSRSRKRTPIAGHTTARSEKDFKADAHRRERSSVRDALRRDGDMPHPKLFGDPWTGPKDGKQFCRSEPHILRK